jgi:hypothetical protein
VTNDRYENCGNSSNNGGNGSNGGGNMGPESNDNVFTQTERSIISLQSDVKNIKEYIIAFKQEINSSNDKIRAEVNGLYKWLIGLFIGGFIVIVIGLMTYNSIQESKIDNI